MKLRRIRVITDPAVREGEDDRRWLASQGLIIEGLPRKATWYRPDGLAIPGLLTDLYHRATYRRKGWTLKPPANVGPADPPPHKPLRMPRLSRAVLRFMDGKDSWEGSATALMALIDPHAPPEGRDYRVFGMPLNPARLSVEIMERRAKDALDESGVFVESWI